MDRRGFFSDLGGQSGAHMAIGADKTELYQLVRGEQAVDLNEDGRRDPGLADGHHGIEFLTEATELGFLGACKCRKGHEGISCREAPRPAQ